MSIRTGVMAKNVILTSFMTSLWRPVTSYGQKFYISLISGPRPFTWYTTRYGWTNFENFEIFDLARPWPRSRSKVKVKVTFEAPLNKLSYKLNMKGLWQLEPELWPKMWFWRHSWRHCDGQWRRTGKKFIPLESVDRVLSPDILLD